MTDVRRRRRPWLAAILTLAAGAGAWLGPTPAARAQAPGIAEVALARPPAEVVPKGQTAARPLVKGARLSEGDRVRTGRGGAAELVLGDGSLVRLGELSDLEIERLDVDPAGAPTTSRFSLAAGQARAWVARQVVAKVATGQGRFAVQTPTAVAAVRQTDFAVLHAVAAAGQALAAGATSRVYTFAGGVETGTVGAGSVLCTRNRWTLASPRQDPTPCQVIPLRDKRELLKQLAFEAFRVDPDDLDRLGIQALGGTLDRSATGGLFGAGGASPAQSGRPDAPGNEGTANIFITVD